MFCVLKNKNVYKIRINSWGYVLDNNILFVSGFGVHSILETEHYKD